MDEVIVEDSYGRKTKFQGDLLVEETTDTKDGRKPRWFEIDVYRTEKGAYVVKRATFFRTVHARTDCFRIDGYDTLSWTGDDFQPCLDCNPNGKPGRVAAPRVTVDIYRTPGELIDSLKFGGTWTNLSRVILKDLSELDEGVYKLWNVVEVE